MRPARQAVYYQIILNGGQLDGQQVDSADAVRQMTSVQTPDLTTGFTLGNGRTADAHSG